ncbi:hypothetical protein WEI85_47665 [Actinomycetes bacterium KLBMP 9797]
MAFRTWCRVLATALGVGLLATASQLGVAFGLGLVRFDRAFDAAAENRWVAQLAWLSWFPIVATVAGALAADRRARQHKHHAGTGSRLGYSVFAGIGAAAALPLCMLPARAADAPSGDPVLIVGLSVGLGVIAGLFAAIVVIGQGPLLGNVVVMSAGVWLLGLISAVQSVREPAPAVRLGTYDAATLADSTTQRLAVLTMPVLALLAGALTAGVSRWLGRPSRAVVASGLIGPAMLALAYLIAGPGSDIDDYQAAPYWGALVAIAAGTLGSALVAVLRRPTRARPSASDAPTTPAPNASDGPPPAGPPPRGTAPADGPTTTPPLPGRSTPPAPPHGGPMPPAPPHGGPMPPAPPHGGPMPPAPPRGGPPLPTTPPHGSPTPPPAPPHGGPPLPPSPPADAVKPAPPKRSGRFGRKKAAAAPEAISGAAAAFSAGRRAATGKAAPPPASSAPPPAAQRRPEPAMPARDEEYVDWVSGLSDLPPRP